MILKQASNDIVKRFEDSFKAAEVLKEINDATLTSTRGSDMIQKMADAVGDLSKEQAVLALMTKHVSKEDQFAILLKAGLVKETEREVFMTNADNVAKTGNLAITETLKNSYQGLAIAMGLTNVQLGLLLAGLAAVGIGVVAFNHFYDTVDETKEKVKELTSEYKTAIDTANKNLKTIEDLADRYDELSDGVDSLGRNISLSTEDFAEYNDIVNQIADMSPELVKGWTEEGNAILSVKGNVEELTQAYKDAQKAAYETIITGENANGNDIIQAWKDTQNARVLSSIFDLGASDVDKSISKKDAIEQLKALQNMSFERYKEIENITSNGTRDAIASLTDIEKEIGYGSYLYKELGLSTLTSEKEYAELQKKASALVSTYQSEIDSALSDIRSLANAYLNIDPDYEKLDEESKNIASLLVNSLDENIASQFKKQEDINDWVENIIKTVNSEDENVQKAFSDLFSIDFSTMSPDEAKAQIDSLIKVLAEALNEDELELKIRLGFDGYDDLARNYDTVISNAAKKFSGTELNSYSVNSAEDAKAYQAEYEKYQLEKQALDKFAKENSINTQDKIAFWNQCIEESKTSEAAMRKYLEEAPDMFGVEISSVTDSIEQLNTKLKPAMNSIESAWQNIFTENGFNLDEIDLLSIGDSIKSELDGLKELGLDVDYTSFEDFIRVLEDTESTEDDVRNAFDNLAQSVINAGVSGTEDFETLKDALEDLGVVNNDIIAFQSLIQNVDALTASGLNLAEATYEDIELFVKERVEAENATQAIEMLTYQKILNGLADMDTSSEVTNMLALAEKAGVTAEVIGHLTELEKIYQEVASGTLDAEAINGKLARAEELKSLIESEVSNVDYESEVIFKPKLKTGSGSGSGSGSPFDWSDLLDKEITLLEKQLDAELIDFDTYLNKRLALIEQYYNEGKIAADEYYAYLEATYENQISIYDKVISAVTKKLNDQIDDLEKQKEVIEESYQLQIDKIQAEIDLLQKEADKKRDLIDLEKARYEAERARTQRTLKLYNGEQFIYTNDPDSVRDAEENLADKELQFNISTLQEKIDALEKEMSDATSQIDEQIEHLQEYIEQWQEVSDAYEDAQNEMLASQILGANWESEILTMRQDALENFKNNYIAAQQAMADAAWRAAEEQIKAAKEAAKGANGVAGGGESIYPNEEPKWIYNGKEYSEKKDAIDAQKADAKAAYERELNADRGSMPSSVRQKLAEEAKNRIMSRPIVKKYEKGGVIGKDDNFLSSIAKSVGEDTMVAAKEGERILTPLQNENFEKLINIADKLVPVLTDIPFANLVNKNLTPAIAGNSPINFSIGEIHLHEVQDVDTFSKAIINQFPGRVIQAIKK